MLHRASTDKNEQYWGRKYDVFYTKVQADEGISRAAWFSEKYTDMASLPGLRREKWKPPAVVPERAVAVLGSLDRAVWLGLHVAGLVYLAFRRREQLIFIGVPFLVLIVLNLVGKWPIGAFRTNLFLCTYLLPLSLIGFDALIQGSARRAVAALAIVSAVTLVPGFAFGFTLSPPKGFWGARPHDALEIMRRLRAHREQHLRENPKWPRERLVMDCHTWHSQNYYVNYHPTFSREQGEFFRKNFVWEKGCGGEGETIHRFRRLFRKAKQPVWVIVSKPSSMEPIEKMLRKDTRVLLKEQLSEWHVMFLVERKKK
jgi:hypothetical protein